MRNRASADVLDDAIAWQLRLGAGDASAADHAEFNRWLDARPDHALVWQRLQALDQVLSPAAREPERAAVVHAPPRQAMRRIGGTLAVLVLLVGVGAGTFEPGTWQHLLADHRTGIGERRSLTLADGSRLQLNTRSAVDVAFDAQRRAVRLRAGEIAIETARPAPGQPTDPRPFIVRTPRGELQALGTRFLVRIEPDRVQLTVLQDAVAARPAGCGPFAGSTSAAHGANPGCAAEGVIRQGQTAELHDTEVRSGPPAATDADAWRDGVLVFDNARLAEVVAEIARHRVGHLGVHASLAERRVSGTFPLDDTDHALEALLRGLSTPGAPLHLRRLAPWWVDIEPGPGR
ncbi:MAG: FecR domain-containing protein [Pseudomonadota bacterium]